MKYLVVSADVDQRNININGSIIRTLSNNGRNTIKHLYQLDKGVEKLSRYNDGVEFLTYDQVAPLIKNKKFGTFGNIKYTLGPGPSDTAFDLSPGTSVPTFRQFLVEHAFADEFELWDRERLKNYILEEGLDDSKTTRTQMLMEIRNRANVKPKDLERVFEYVTPEKLRSWFEHHGGYTDLQPASVGTLLEVLRQRVIKDNYPSSKTRISKSVEHLFERQLNSLFAGDEIMVVTINSVSDRGNASPKTLIENLRLLNIPKTVRELSSSSVDYRTEERNSCVPIENDNFVKVYWRGHEIDKLSSWNVYSWKEGKENNNSNVLEDGVYNYLLTVDQDQSEQSFNMFVVKWNPGEVATKHLAISTIIPENSRIVAAGEIQVEDSGETFGVNDTSGTFMETIQRMCAVNLSNSPEDHRQFMMRPIFWVPFVIFMFQRIFPGVNIYHRAKMTDPDTNIQTNETFLKAICNSISSRHMPVYRNDGRCINKNKTNGVDYCDGDVKTTRRTSPKRKKNSIAKTLF
jgi:hypothetical protein